MSRTSAARRASRGVLPASSSPGSRRAASAGVCDSARCTPTTSCPASTARAAATAESTPPLIAASTLIGPARARPSRGPALPRPLDRRPTDRRRPRRRRRTAVEVCPRENRSELRATASSAPMASSTWLGCATPAVHAEPVEHSMPWASSSMSRLSPSHPGKDRCALPGSRDGPPSTTPVPGSPFRVRVGDGGEDLADEVVAQPGQGGRPTGGRRRPPARPPWPGPPRRGCPGCRTARRAPGRHRAGAA